MRVRIITSIGITMAIVASAANLSAFESIDLDVPGNLATIERDHPDHFAKIRRILAEIPRRPPGENHV